MTAQKEIAEYFEGLVIALIRGAYTKEDLASIKSSVGRFEFEISEMLGRIEKAIQQKEKSMGVE